VIVVTAAGAAPPTPASSDVLAGTPNTILRMRRMETSRFPG